MELNPSLKQRLISANLLPKEELTRKQDIATESTENIKPPDFSFRVRRVYQSQRFSVIIATRRLLAGRERIKIFRKRQLRLL
jgi:hypothetical protein